MSARDNPLLRTERAKPQADLGEVMSRLAVPLCERLVNAIGVGVEARADGLGMQSYDAWEGYDWPGGAFGSGAAMSLAVAVSPALPAALLDRRFGGLGSVETRPMGRAGAALARTVAQVAAAALGQAFCGLAHIGPLGFEAEMSRGGYARHDDRVLTSAIDLSLDGDIDGRIAFAFAPSAFHASPAIGDTTDWSARLASGVLGTRMAVRAVLARPELTAAAVAHLAIGDVMPIARPARLPLLIGAHRLAFGTLDECDGQAAIRIDAMEICHD